MSFFRSLFGRQKAKSEPALPVAAASAPYAALTHPGQRHTHNEDCATARRLPDGTILLAVADGVGGHGGGDVASAEAIRAVIDELSSPGPANVEARIEAAFAAANSRVLAEAAKKTELSKMACTLVVAVVDEGSAWLAHLGDSRAYLATGSELRQLTEDHSWVAEQVRAGSMTLEEAEQSQFRNVITRGIGVETELRLDSMQQLELPGSGVFLLCSDGLFKAVDEEEIRRLLDVDDPEAMAEQLVAAANAAGGPDNIAVALLLTGSTPDQSASGDSD